MDSARYEQSGSKLFDSVEPTASGGAFYNLYARDGLHRVETLVLEDAKISGPTSYQVNDDGHPYPPALAGDHRHAFIPAELEARAAKLAAVLEATAPHLRTTLSRDQPPRSIGQASRPRSRESDKDRER